MHAGEIGRQFSMLLLSPFLCMETMWANFHSAGIEPVLKDKLNNDCNGYAINTVKGPYIATF